MNKDTFNAFCASLPKTTHVVQWGGADVWKVGGKVFAIGGWNKKNKNKPAFTFKVTPLSYEILKEEKGLQPAPYLASRGFKWIQDYREPGLPEDDLKRYIKTSYNLVVEKLTKKIRKELGH